MSVFTILTLAVGLAMDAFAVSICKGLAMKKVTAKKMFIVGIWFGGFQALMPKNRLHARPLLKVLPLSY